MNYRSLPLLLCLLVAGDGGASCPANEILLRNRTCHCPFFKFNGRCLRHRYQTTVVATLDALLNHSRHLMSSSSPLLITIDASNAEAMQALADSLEPLRSAGTVVTRVVDSVDTLVGGDASATMEIVDVSVSSGASVLTLTVDCRLPLTDFFFFYVHLGAEADPPCPPFHAGCCRGDMGGGGGAFLTTDVDCTANNPLQQMDAFVRAWNGAYLSPGSRERFNVSIALGRADIPSTIENGARVLRLGLGMVVFGKLSQNTESRVELQLNSSSTTTSFGQFRYSFIEYTRLQLEGCEGVVFAHLIVKASRVTGVHSLRYRGWDGGEWITPSCSSGAVMLKGTTLLSGCNVSITDQFVDVYLSMKGVALNETTAVYVLLQRADVLTRVVAKTDSTVLQHCNAPITIGTSLHAAFNIEVKQGSKLKYSGPPQLVELTDVAALHLRIVSKSPAYEYAFDNVSVIYSLVDSSQVLSRMQGGKITPELEALCDEGHVCLIETLLQGGVCQTMDKCELQGDSGLFLMPLYPWGQSTLKTGTYTVMVSEIKETIIAAPAAGGGVMRRLLGWIWER